MGDISGAISNRSDAHFFRVQGAVFSSIDERSLPPTAGKDRVPQVRVKRRRMLAGLEQAGALSDHFLAGITGQLLKRIVNPNNLCPPVRDYDRIGRGFQCCGLQLYQLLALATSKILRSGIPHVYLIALMSIHLARC